MERRSFVGLAPAGVLGVISPEAGEEAPVFSGPRQFTDYDEWLNESRRALLAYLKAEGPANTERFMQFLAAWVTGMPKTPSPKWGSIPGANRSLDFAMLSSGRPFVVTTFRMAPGCRQPAHCHPGGGGVTLCVEGGLVMRHFNLLPDQPPFSETGAKVEIEETAIARLTRDTFTLFTPTRSNLHQLEAGPEGAVCVDIVVQWQGAGQFSYLKLRSEDAGAPPRPGQRLRGEWVGMDIAKAYPEGATHPSS